MSQGAWAECRASPSDHGLPRDQAGDGAQRAGALRQDRGPPCSADRRFGLDSNRSLARLACLPCRWDPSDTCAGPSRNDPIVLNASREFVLRGPGPPRPLVGRGADSRSGAATPRKHLDVSRISTTVWQRWPSDAPGLLRHFHVAGWSPITWRRQPGWCWEAVQHKRRPLLPPGRAGACP